MGRKVFQPEQIISQLYWVGGGTPRDWPLGPIQWAVGALAWSVAGSLPIQDYRFVISIIKQENPYTGDDLGQTTD